MLSFHPKRVKPNRNEGPFLNSNFLASIMIFIHIFINIFRKECFEVSFNYLFFELRQNSAK